MLPHFSLSLYRMYSNENKFTLRGAMGIMKERKQNEKWKFSTVIW